MTAITPCPQPGCSGVTVWRFVDTATNVYRWSWACDGLPDGVSMVSMVAALTAATEAHSGSEVER